MDQPKYPPRPSQAARGSQGEVIDLPMTPEVFNAKLNKLVSLTAILHQDGETLWDKVVNLQDSAKLTNIALAAVVTSNEKSHSLMAELVENQKILVKSHQTLTDHVLTIKSPVSKLQAVFFIVLGSAMGGGAVALAFHYVTLVLHH